MKGGQMEARKSGRSTCPAAIFLFFLHFSYLFLHLQNHRKSRNIKQFMVQQVGDDPFFDAVMERKQDCDQEYLDKQDLPWLSMCEFMDLLVGQ